METIERIIRLMKSAKMNQQQLAEIIGVKKNVITKWKTRESQSYVKHIIKIAEALDTTTEYLLRGNELYRYPDSHSDFEKLADSPEVKEAVKEANEEFQRKNSKAATLEGSGLADEFARIFVQLTPENQNRIIAEMLKRQRNQ